MCILRALNVHTKFACQMRIWRHLMCILRRVIASNLHIQFAHQMCISIHRICICRHIMAFHVHIKFARQVCILRDPMCILRHTIAWSVHITFSHANSRILHVNLRRVPPPAGSTFSHRFGDYSYAWVQIMHWPLRHWAQYSPQTVSYGVALVCKIDSIISLFCKRAL